MITSYFKTAKRVITRNRIFSLINIVGLAASMSVGLLFITILADILRYDQFHEHSDRIVRVFTDHRDNQGEVKLATTPFPLGEAIRHSLPEAEQVTTVGHGFGGDFSLNDRVHPLNGLWAQPSFFEIFSFPLLKGDPATALRDPNTMVITESAALRIFGTTNVLGKSLTKGNVEAGDNPEFVITGVMGDVSKFSHMNFEALGSLATHENNRSLAEWMNVWSNYTYVLLNKGVSEIQLESSLKAIAGEHSTTGNENQVSISFGVQKLTDIVFFSQRLDNQVGPSMPTRFLWLISSLSIIVLITACFNYTNLSIARASTRMREVGIRKVVGAKRTQVAAQFITESVVISLMALVFAFAIFAMIKTQFLQLTPNLGRLFNLDLTPAHVISFVAFAIAIGLFSGLVPGVFFSKMNAVTVLRGSGAWKIPTKFAVRKALVVVQYVFALAFITSTVILYKQYQDFINFDLGFKTNNILNIKLNSVKPEVLGQKLAALPEVQQTSSSMMVTSIGNNYYTYVKGADPADSVQTWYNKIDESYLPFFDFKLVAGRNLDNKIDSLPEQQVVINETLMKQLALGGGDPEKAVNETVTIEGKKLTVVGVMKDFHYSTLDRKIGPFVFRQLGRAGILNVKIASRDLPATMAKIETIWRSVDDAHPLNAQFYDSQIEHAYREYGSIGKLVGFLAFITIVICSLGLLGMVVFAAESRMKEMSIRRVMGAPAWNVTFLLSRNFLALLSLSALIAIPLTWTFFTKVVLSNVAYHNPIGFIELFFGAFVVGAVALTVVFTQGVRVARKNPLEVLRAE